MDSSLNLSRLTASEREVLMLLAEGHTTKSVAARLGRSESSINERLREARRKTGVGSSRELARLLRAQENRDKQIGVVEPVALTPAPVGAPLLARYRRKVLFVTIPLLAIAAAVVMLTLRPADRQAMPQPPQPAQPSIPSGSEAIAGRDASMRATLHAEAPDAAWAGAAEAALRRRYLAIDGIDASYLRIDCRATLCEVDGRLRSGIGAAVGERAVDVIGSPELRRSVAGLHALSTHGTSEGEGTAFHGEFTAIWRRTDT